MSDDIECIEVRITGRVQGVSFRAWTRERARAHGLSGWVRNEADGSVRACLEGAPEALEAMRAELSKGPPAARVSGVGIVDRPSGCGTGSGVEIRG